jgi:tRNA nucleotidyltransferase (CCA-adding enzyme)
MAESRSSGTIFLDLSSEQKSSLEQIRSHPSVQKIADALQDSSLCLVGGAVREALLLKYAADIDLASSFTSEKVKQLLAKAGINTYDTGLKHGTISALVDGSSIEITTFRKKPGSLEEDLLARDFTINAIALRLSDSAIIDPSFGFKDITENILKCAGNPEQRFNEDPLRILRMIRFGPAAGRIVEEKTKKAADKLKASLKTVSVERIRDELVYILLSAHPAEALQMMHSLALLELIIPEVLPSIGFEQNEFHIHDVFEHTLWVIERTPADKTLRLAALFHDLGKPHTLSVDEAGRRHFYNHEKISTDIGNAVMKRLRFSHQEIHDVSTIVRYHMRPLDCGPAGVRRLMRDLDHQFDAWRQFKKADSPPVLGEEDFETRAARFDGMVKDEIARLEKAQSKTLCVDGYDLMAIGVQKGPQVGEALKHLEEIVIEDPEKNQKETLLLLAREWLQDLV